MEWLGRAQVWRWIEAGESPGLEVEAASLVMTMKKLPTMEPEPTSCVKWRRTRITKMVWRAANCPPQR